MARNIYACRLSPRLLGTPNVKDFFEKIFRDMERPRKGRYNWASPVPHFEQGALVLFFDIDGTSILGEAVFLGKEELNDTYSADDSSWCLWFDWETIHCYGTKVPTSEFETLKGGKIIVGVQESALRVLDWSGLATSYRNNTTNENGYASAQAAHNFSLAMITNDIVMLGFSPCLCGSVRKWF